MRSLVMLLFLSTAASAAAQDWRAASLEPVGLAPNPQTTPEAVVQVYGARTRGLTLIPERAYYC